MSAKPDDVAYRRIDTRPLVPAQGEDTWREVLNPVTSPDRLHRRPFGGRIDAWLGGTGMLCDIHASAQITRRDATQLALGGAPLYLVMLVIRGRVRYHDCEHDLSLGAGDILLEDMSRPRQIVTDGLVSLQLILPQEDEELPLPPGLHGTRLMPRHPATRLLGRHLMATRELVEGLRREQFERCQRVCRALILAALTSQRQPPGLSHVHQAIRREVLGYIDAHLNDPALSAGHLAQRFQISRSQLYRLFRDAGGPSAFIRFRRLCWVAKQMTEQRGQATDWATLADQLCFSSETALRQAFEQTFEMSLEHFDQLSREHLNPIQDDPLPQLFARLPQGQAGDLLQRLEV